MSLPICEALTKTHPELICCEANENLLSESVTNFSDGDLEGAFQELNATGSLALQTTDQQRQEAERKRQSAEKQRRTHANDDRRFLEKLAETDPEKYRAELRKRRAAETKANQEAAAEHNRNLQQLSVEELRKLARAESEAKGFKVTILKGSDAEGSW